MDISDKTVKQIKDTIASLSYEEYAEYIKELYHDSRESVKKLALSMNKSYEKYLAELKRIERMKMIESNYRTKGYKLIAGCDEAGRGPLCGPVVSAVVILPEDFNELYVNDSKKLTESKRNKLYDIITEKAVCWAVGIADNEVIDKINILSATKKTITDALDKMKIKPDMLLLDALEIDYDIPQKGFVKGDANVYSIAAASIVAKVTRDRLMYEYDKQYPEYGFASNKGYGTAEHIKAIEKYGITPIHRKSFLSGITNQMPSREIGNCFEQEAVDFLKSKGCEIIQRSVKRGSGEIDIIYDDAGVTVFCEVKERKDNFHGTAEEQVGYDKQKRIKDAAQIYISEKGITTPVRFDIIAFNVYNNDKFSLKHYKNAF